MTVQPQQFVRFAADPAHYGDRIFGPVVWRDVQHVVSDGKVGHIQSRYRETIRTAGFDYVLDFELADEGGSRLYLVYGTSHPLGVEKMKDAMWHVDPYRGGGYRDPRDPQQELLPIEPVPQTGPLRRLLMNHLERFPDRRATVGDLREFALLETVYKEVHVPPVVEELIRQGELVRLDDGTRLTKRSVVATRQQEALPFGA